MESDEGRPALAQARACFDRGDQAAALKLLQARMNEAKKSRDAAALDELLPVARELAARCDPRHAGGYRLLVHGLEQNLAYVERVGPPPSRAVVWAGRRRVAAMVVLCVVVPGLVIAATGNTMVAIIWTELGLFASPIAFFIGGERWGAWIWLCGVAAAYLIGSAALCLLLALFTASLGGAIVLGLVVACVAGTLALLGCVVSGDSLPTLLALETWAVVAIAGALALIASDSEGLHHVVGGAASEETVSDFSGLYTLWAASAALILAGIAWAGLGLRRR